MIEAATAQLHAWLTVAGIAIGLNVVPAFMPPTWAVLAYFHLKEGLAILPLAIVGAAGSATGRALLALLSRAAGDRFLPRRWRANIEILAAALRQRPRLSLSTLILFSLGPLPSNQLFIAAGIARAPLVPILAVFAAFRFASYVLWISLGSTAATSLRELVSPRFGTGGAVIAQIAGLVLLIALMQIDWRRILRRA